MKLSRIILTTMLGTLVSGMVVSCGGGDDFSYDGPVPEGRVSGESTDNSWSDDPAAKGYEVPAIRQGDGIYFVSHYARLNNSSSEKGLNYCLEWDASAYHSRWVAFVFDNTNNAKRVSRTNTWAEDPDLPQSVRLSVNSYSGSGYTRGHICASADRLNSTEANNQTFYMSNMTPQLYDYNGGYWAVLEALVQNWGRSTKFKRVYVCKGGTIRDDQLRGTFNTNNASGRSCKVKIPKYNFMAILAETAGGSFQSIGFWMEHKDYSDGSGHYSSDNRAPTYLMKGHAMSIDELENKTGINFFCNLNDALENAVESSYSESAWTW
ncbi:MAG: DNA/RNA non-specific endonuclease [Bacteroidaceae bacterium]|nr:DNA/RNA non-specific endonuclease [Bacteroidaceae bacterium]